MNPPTALAAALMLLSEALDEPAVDLGAELIALGADAAHAVPSYLGLTVVATTDLGPVTMTVPPELPALAPIRSSLGIDLPPVLPSTPSMTVTLYAATAGAFVDLAADLAFMFGLSLADIAIDQQLSPPTAEEPGVAEWAWINQAIGVLIDRGYLPEQARAVLHRDAARAGMTLAATAALLLASLTD